MTDLERKIHSLFVEAFEKPSNEWEAFLEEKCDSPDVRMKVQELLDSHQEIGNFLNESALETYPNLAFPFGGQVEEFRILRLIGMGGMGHVYLAEDSILNRKVALKVVGASSKPGNSRDEIAEKFQREARAAARLVHPSVVQVYRTGEKDGLAYIVMEYVEGMTLCEKLEAFRSATGPVKKERFLEVAKLVSQIADAIDHGHRVGVIHRDVKPSNILIDRDGNARLADFGIAKIDTEETIQRTGTIVASCAYMSPEQARIQETKVDHRTDIFSLGVVLYESIAQKRPFDGSSVRDVMAALANCDPEPLRKIEKKIPNDLAVICHKAIEKKVEDRYQSAAHFFGDLQCFLDGRPILARPPGVVRRTKNWIQKNQTTTFLTAICILIFSILGLTITIQALLRQQMGVIRVSEKHSGAEVMVAKYSSDMKLEAYETIGIAPVSVYLNPGMYRIEIHDGDSILETSSYVTPGFVDEISVNKPSKKCLDSFVEIAGGKYQLGSSEYSSQLQRAREVVLNSFRISPYEVSNRDYQEYILSTGTDPPHYWAELNFKEIEDLPVVGITWDEANLYCRWKGVRLPTPDEWEAASKGPNKSGYPWGNEPSENIKRQEARRLSPKSYLRFARAIDSDDHLATPLGVRHMVSNVQEYTEGVSSDQTQLVLKGRSWRDSEHHDPWKVMFFSGRDKRALNRGFRVMAPYRDER